MIKTILALAILTLSLSCASKPKSDSNSGKPDLANSSFLDPNTVDFTRVIPGPPEKDSEDYKNDFKVLKKFQKTRSKADCAAADKEVSFESFISFYELPQGPLTRPEAEHWKTFIEQVIKDARPVTAKAKNYWKRPRPYFTDKKLHACVKKETSFAYPSGHAGAGELAARVLADIFPDRKDALMKRGVLMGDHRVVAGVHHPSDVRDARILADYVYGELYKNQNFVSALNALKAQ